MVMPNSLSLNTQPSTQLKLISVFVAVCLVVAGWHLYVGREEIFRKHGSQSYGLLAESLVQQQRLALDGQTPTAYRPPLYPLFLAGLLWLTGDLQAAIMAQSLLLSLALGCLALITLTYTGQIWPVIGMVLLYAYLPEITLENITQRDTGLFTFLLALSGFIFVSLERRYRWPQAALLGLVLGLLSLTRPVALVGPFLAVVWGGRLWLKQMPWSQIGQRVLPLLAAFYMILLPWGVRNWLVLGQFTLSSTTTGLNLWKGNNPATAVLYPAMDVDALDALLDEPPAGPGWWDELRVLPTLSEADRNRLFQRLALNYIMEQPGQFLKMGLVKVYTLWLPQYTPLGEGEVEWMPEGAKIVEYELNRHPIAPYLLLYLLAGLGFWLLRGTAYSWYVLSWVVFFSLIHFATFGESRFSWPVHVLALPLAAAGLYGLFEARRKLLTALITPRD